jgi:hypothetical protein
VSNAAAAAATIFFIFGIRKLFFLANLSTGIYSCYGKDIILLHTVLNWR